MGVVAPPRKLFPNWTKVSLRMMSQLKRANEKHSFEQVLHFPIVQTVQAFVSFGVLKIMVYQKIRNIMV